jgi:hypothetical protein
MIFQYFNYLQLKIQDKIDRVEFSDDHFIVCP